MKELKELLFWPVIGLLLGYGIYLVLKTTYTPGDSMMSDILRLLLPMALSTGLMAISVCSAALRLKEHFRPTV